MSLKPHLRSLSLSYSEQTFTILVSPVYTHCWFSVTTPSYIPKKSQENNVHLEEEKLKFFLLFLSIKPLQEQKYSLWFIQLSLKKWYLEMPWAFL